MSEPADTDPPDVNPQIVDAVRKSTEFAFGMPDAKAEVAGSGGGPPKYDAGAAIAYQKVAQATAYAVQDATDYQRDVLSVSNVVQGKAQALMLEYAAKNQWEQLGLTAIVFALSIGGTLMANMVVKEIGTTAGDVLRNFPPNPGSGA